MKFFDKLGKLEQGIGRTVGFSKGFGTFEKADVANRVRIMMDDESYVDGSGRTMAPNIYTLRFAPVDFPRVREWGNPFAVELCDLAISHARAQGYTLIGAVRVTFNVLDSLAEGEFEVVATFEPFSVPDAPASPTLRGAPDNVTVVALQVIDREELPVDEPVGPSALPDSALPDSIAAEQEVSVNTQKLPEIAATAEAAEATLAALEQESAHHNVRRFRRARDFAGTLLHSGSDAVRHHIGTYDNAVDAALTNAAILRGELGSRPHQLVGAAAVATETGMIPAVTSRTLEHRATVAQRMPLTVDEAPLPAELEELIAEEPAERTSRRSWSVRLFIFLLVAALLTLAAWTGLRYVERSYYVGESDGTVAVYNGIPQALGPIRLSHVVENTDISTSQLSNHTRTLLRNSITAKDLNEAHQIVSRLKTQAEQNRIKAEQAASASASPTPDPTATASLAPEPAESGAETPTESPSTEGGENRG